MFLQAKELTRFTVNIFCKFIPLKIGGFKKVVPLHPLLSPIVVSTEHIVLSADGLH
jgi:hypothetical protein